MNPDVLVSYDVIVERNVDVQNDPVYSQPYSGLYYNRLTLEDGLLFIFLLNSWAISNIRFR